MRRLPDAPFFRVRKRFVSKKQLVLPVKIAPKKGDFLKSCRKFGVFAEILQIEKEKGLVFIDERAKKKYNILYAI